MITTSHITLKTVDETTFTLPTERTNFTLDLHMKKWWPTRKSTSRTNNDTLKKAKAKRQEIKRKEFVKEL